jgi:hypothetical protein
VIFHHFFKNFQCLWNFNEFYILKYLVLFLKYIHRLRRGRIVGPKGGTTALPPSNSNRDRRLASLAALTEKAQLE